MFADWCLRACCRSWRCVESGRRSRFRLILRSAVTPPTAAGPAPAMGPGQGGELATEGPPGTPSQAHVPLEVLPIPVDSPSALSDLPPLSTSTPTSSPSDAPLVHAGQGLATLTVDNAPAAVQPPAQEESVAAKPPASWQRRASSVCPRQPSQAESVASRNPFGTLLAPLWCPFGATPQSRKRTDGGGSRNRHASFSARPWRPHSRLQYAAVGPDCVATHSRREPTRLEHCGKRDRRGRSCSPKVSKSLSHRHLARYLWISSMAAKP